MGHEQAVERLYVAGVTAVGDVTAGLDPQGWDEVVCGTWSATDTTRHLCAVVGWYDAWLDRALEGDAQPPFPVEEMASQNDRALLDVAELDGPTAAERFDREARAYLERAREHTDTPYGYPSGTVTVGLHLGVAATEWHLHAWDLSGHRHQPEDPGALFAAAGRCVATATGGVRGRVLGGLVPLGARRKPWASLLHHAGR